jgi:hypothetical protein
VATSFLLVEHPGPWRFDALTGAGWSPEVVEALTAAVRTTRSRLLLIRRPGRRVSAPERSWAITTVGGTTTWGTWQQDRDLIAVADVLTSPAPSTPASATEDPVLLVCAHGQHDTCCAVRGRPVAAALAARWPDATWECSHVGGDRFAANLVVLPDGTYYGDLDAESAVEVVTGHLAGRLDPARLRGSVRWPPPAQVAVGEVHRREGPFGADEVRADSWTLVAPGRWLIEVSVDGGRRRRVEVTSERRPATRLTCSAQQDSFATTYRVVGVDPTDQPTGQITIP